MKVTSKELEKSQVELTIEVSVEEIKPFVEESAKKIAKEVDIKGFRKGKVPYDVLKQHVGEATIYEEAFNAIVEGTYPKAIEEEKLEVAGRADINVEKIAPDNPIIYTATVPLMPTVKLGDYKKIKTKKGEKKVDDAKFDKTLEDLRKMRGKEKVVNRAAKTGDKAMIDFDVKIGGVSIEGGQGTDYGLMLGDKQFIPGFEEAVEGMAKGEEKDFEVTFPDDYSKKDLQGKKAQVHVKLSDVYEIELPELNDEIAKEMNFESLDKLKTEIRSNLEREAEQQVNEEFEGKVIDEIIELSEFDELPDQLVDDEATKMLAELKHDIMQQGLNYDDYLSHMKKKEDELLEGFKETAAKRLKGALVMREVAIAEEVKVEVAEIDKELEEMKKLYKDMPEAAVQLETPEQRQRMENMMIHKKVFESLEAYTK